MRIEQYISDLLYRYECVIVPEYGAFLTRRKSAAINESTNVFHPPQKALSFNRQLQNNDGLLANYIASSESCSYNEALKKIQHFVFEINSEIQKGKRVQLDKIGSFFKSVENALQFEPENNVNYLTESFGLSSFEYPKINRAVVREELKKEVEALEEKTPIAFTPEKRNEKNYMKYAAIAVVALGICFLGWKHYDNSTILAVNTENAEKEKLNILEAGYTYNAKEDLPAVALNVLTNEGFSEVGQMASSNTNGAGSASGKYHVIAGAFRISSNADKKVRQLLESGYSPKRIGANKYGLHQVTYGSYADKYEALEKLREIKRTHNERAWLLVEDL